LVQDDARLESLIAFWRLICFHLLWPAMATLLAAAVLEERGTPEGTPRDHRAKNKRDNALRQRGALDPTARSG
jgi:hypothetical protein